MGLLQQFKQQMMKAWQPVPTLTKTIILFFIMAAIFLSIGVAMIVVSKNLGESSFRYDNLQSTTCPIGSTCNVTFEVNQLLQSPVFVYYEIHNFYQNHRLYASSFSYDQLTGTEISSSTVYIITKHRPNHHALQSFTIEIFIKMYQPLILLLSLVQAMSPILAE